MHVPNDDNIKLVGVLSWSMRVRRNVCRLKTNVFTCERRQWWAAGEAGEVRSPGDRVSEWSGRSAAGAEPRLASHGPVVAFGRCHYVERGCLPPSAACRGATTRRGRASLSSCAKVVTCVTPYHFPTREHHHCSRTIQWNGSIWQVNNNLMVVSYF